MKTFLAGLGIGAGVGVLLARESGHELRGRVGAWLREMLNGFPISRNPASASALNTATREQLLEVTGIGPVLAGRILQSRPYRYPEELVERGILPRSAFQRIKRELLHQRSA